MSAFPRNAPCPCGSGLKYKRCCIDRERELLRRASALEELVGLPRLFPRLRPSEPEFEAWASSLAAGELSPELIDDGVARLTADERRRIETAYASEFPLVWEELSAELGDAADDSNLLVAAAVGASLHERRRLDPNEVAHLEECDDCRSGPAEALAVVLEACDLWSVVEAASEEDRFWSNDHERRLQLLVARVQRQLPLTEHPLASAALVSACSVVFAEAEVRDRLAAFLLEQATATFELLAQAAHAA